MSGSINIEELRCKYANGQASEKESEEFWAEVLRDPEQLELLKTEVNLKAVINKNRIEKKN